MEYLSSSFTPVPDIMGSSSKYRGDSTKDTLQPCGGDELKGSSMVPQTQQNKPLLFKNH